MVGVVAGVKDDVEGSVCDGSVKNLATALQQHFHILITDENSVCLELWQKNSSLGSIVVPCNVSV